MKREDMQNLRTENFILFSLDAVQEFFCCHLGSRLPCSHVKLSSHSEAPRHKGCVELLISVWNFCSERSATRALHQVGPLVISFPPPSRMDGTWTANRWSHHGFFGSDEIAGRTWEKTTRKSKSSKSTNGSLVSNFIGCWFSSHF